jgi:hypothetical protein
VRSGGEVDQGASQCRSMCLSILRIVDPTPAAACSDRGEVEALWARDGDSVAKRFHLIITPVSSRLQHVYQCLLITKAKASEPTPRVTDGAYDSSLVDRHSISFSGGGEKKEKSGCTSKQGPQSRTPREQASGPKLQVRQSCFR